MEEMLGSSGDSTTAINSSNIGFKLLKKQGWKEGTGLGISEQGRLEPVETHVKNNKRGLGADKVKKKTVKPDQSDAPKGNDKQEHLSQKKAKALSKRMRKMQEFEKKMQEKEFEREFFKEFWPENRSASMQVGRMGIHIPSTEEDFGVRSRCKLDLKGVFTIVTYTDALSKRTRKMQEFQKKMQEKEFERLESSGQKMYEN